MSELEWKEADTIKVSSLVATINRAILDNGNIFHSIRIFHSSPEGKLTQFLRPSDLSSLEELGREVRYWIQADIDEIRNPAQENGSEKLE